MATEYLNKDAESYKNIDDEFLYYHDSQLHNAFLNVIETVPEKVTDKTFNVTANIADCVKTNFALYDDIQKQIKIGVEPCFKGYVTDNKILIATMTLLFKSTAAAAFTPLNNVTLCLKSNALTDAKSINAANNCTVAAFVTCLGYVSFYNLEIEILGKIYLFSKIFLGNYGSTSLCCSFCHKYPRYCSNSVWWQT